jgi:hypothetical protein
VCSRQWVVWLTFLIEVCVMLWVVRDRRAWIDGHRREWLVVVLAPRCGCSSSRRPSRAIKLSKAIELAKLGESVPAAATLAPHPPRRRSRLARWRRAGGKP